MTKVFYRNCILTQKLIFIYGVFSIHIIFQKISAGSASINLRIAIPADPIHIIKIKTKIKIVLLASIIIGNFVEFLTTEYKTWPEK